MSAARGHRSLDGYLCAGKQGLVLNHGSLPGAFDIHFRRVNRAAGGGRGPLQQASARPFLRFAEFSGSSDSSRSDRAVSPAQGDRGVQRYVPVRVLLEFRGTRGAAHAQE